MLLSITSNYHAFAINLERRFPGVVGGFDFRRRSRDVRTVSTLAHEGRPAAVATANSQERFLQVGTADAHQIGCGLRQNALPLLEPKRSRYRHSCHHKCQITVPSISTAPLGMTTTPSRIT